MLYIATKTKMNRKHFSVANGKGSFHFKGGLDKITTYIRYNENGSAIN